jgi:hypothetical protein
MPTVITALEARPELKVAEFKKRYHELFGEERMLRIPLLAAPASFVAPSP